MSELVKKNGNSATIRWRLLNGASAVVLTASIAAMCAAHADDNGRPQVWLELGGGLNRLGDSQESFAPRFLALEPAQFSSPQKALRPPLYGMDLSGAVSVQPEGSDWIFSAAIRYGRSSSKHHQRQQSYPAPASKYVYYSAFGNGHILHYTQKPFAAKFIDAQSKNSENHSVVDFQAGRDLGIGLFGKESSSSLSVGVRIAQFTSKSHVSLHENPDWAFHEYHYTFAYPPYFSQRFVVFHQPYHSYAGLLDAERSFHGIGPSLTWKSSAPIVGNTQNGVLAFDWGINAALLFGRQKTKVHHQTTAEYHPPGTGLFGSAYGGNRIVRYQIPATPDRTRAHNVTIPNIGGFAGLSFQYPNAKVSFGYRADFFFGAMDGGIDTRKTFDRNFYGPFATVSIGLGG